MIGCGAGFAAFVNSDLLQLIFDSLCHTNRFVRETGYKTLAAIIKCPGTPLPCGPPMSVVTCLCVCTCACAYVGLDESTISSLWPGVADHLATGLADNWSQVRTVHVHVRTYYIMNLCIIIVATPRDLLNRLLWRGGLPTRHGCNREVACIRRGCNREVA